MQNDYWWWKTTRRSQFTIVTSLEVKGYAVDAVSTTGEAIDG